MAFLAILLDKPIEVKLDATGKIVSASGMNEALDAVAAEDPTKAQMVQGLKEQYGSNQAAQMVDWGGKMMPPGPVAVGASWDRQYAEAIPMIGEVDVKQTCALKELKSSPTGKIAVISFTVTAEKDEITRPAGEGGMEMTFSDIKMGQTGTLELMLDSGMPLSQTTDQTMAMAIAMKRPAAPAAEGQAPPEAPAMQMTTKQASKVRATLTPGKYVPPVIAPVAPVAPEAPAAPPVPAAEPAPTAEPAPVAE